MSSQLETFKSILPDYLKKVLKGSSLDYRDMLGTVRTHLKDLYKDRGDWENCLRQYFLCDEYQQSCHQANSCDEIPEISIDEVRKMIIEEEHYSLSISKLHMLVDREKNGTDTLWEQANLLGILPTRDEESLFKHFLFTDGMTQNECDELLKNAINNRNIIDVCTYCLRKIFEDGIVFSFPQVGEIMTQQRGKYYYRGENAFYSQSNASFYRATEECIAGDIKWIVDQLRLYECWETLDHLDAVKGWLRSDNDYMALAQHYGFRTKMMDITTNIKTALFFACCTFENNCWRPLKYEEIENCDSRKNIFNQGGDARYGILFRSPMDIMDMKWAIHGRDNYNQLITPIGYQALQRCSTQSGYMMFCPNENYDLKKDTLFEKYKFRLDPSFCKEVYDMNERGNMIYPNKDIPGLEKHIKAINTTRVFSRKTFNILMEQLGIYRDGYISLESRAVSMNVEAILGKEGFYIKENVQHIPPSILKNMNQCYSKEFVDSHMEIVPKIAPKFFI